MFTTENEIIRSSLCQMYSLLEFKLEKNHWDLEKSGKVRKILNLTADDVNIVFSAPCPRL